MKFFRFFPVLILLSTFVLTTCSFPDDTTTVTIYFSSDKQTKSEYEKESLIDRFLNFFSSKAYAQIHQTEDTEYYFLWVTADDIDEESYYTPLIPGTETSISIDVPSGSNRVFTLLSISPNGNYNYVGQTVTDLIGGEISISIN